MSRLSRGLTHRGSLRERTLRAGPIFSALCTLSESLSDSVVGAARGAVCRRATGCAGLESWGSGWWASADCYAALRRARSFSSRSWSARPLALRRLSRTGFKVRADARCGFIYTHP